MDTAPAEWVKPPGAASRHDEHRAEVALEPVLLAIESVLSHLQVLERLVPAGHGRGHEGAVVVRHEPEWQARGFDILARHKWLIGSLIVVYKLLDEWITHVGNIDRSELFDRLLEQLFGG